ncbi:hypothetical protein KI387_031218, partial [Taxus chinensis]
ASFLLGGIAFECGAQNSQLLVPSSAFSPHLRTWKASLFPLTASSGHFLENSWSISPLKGITQPTISWRRELKNTEETFLKPSFWEPLWSSSTALQATAFSSPMKTNSSKSLGLLLLLSYLEISCLRKLGHEAKDVRKMLLTLLKPEALQNFVGRTESIIHDHLTRYWVGNE